jgi:hypothetical protein
MVLATLLPYAVLRHLLLTGWGGNTIVSSAAPPTGVSWRGHGAIPQIQLMHHPQACIAKGGQEEYCHSSNWSHTLVCTTAEGVGNEAITPAAIHLVLLPQKW